MFSYYDILLSSFRLIVLFRDSSYYNNQHGSGLTAASPFLLLIRSRKVDGFMVRNSTKLTLQYHVFNYVCSLGGEDRGLRVRIRDSLGFLPQCNFFT